MKREIEEHLHRAKEFVRAADFMMARRMKAVALELVYYPLFHVATAALLKHGIESVSRHSVIAAFGEFTIGPGLVPKHLQRWLGSALEACGDSSRACTQAVSDKRVRMHLDRAREFVSVCRPVCES